MRPFAASVVRSAHPSACSTTRARKPGVVRTRRARRIWTNPRGRGDPAAHGSRTALADPAPGRNAPTSALSPGAALGPAPRSVSDFTLSSRRSPKRSTISSTSSAPSQRGGHVRGGRQVASVVAQEDVARTNAQSCGERTGGSHGARPARETRRNLPLQPRGPALGSRLACGAAGPCRLKGKRASAGSHGSTEKSGPRAGGQPGIDSGEIAMHWQAGSLGTDRSEFVGCSAAEGTGSVPAPGGADRERKGSPHGRVGAPRSGSRRQAGPHHGALPPPYRGRP